MVITTQGGALERASADALVLGVFEATRKLGGAAAAVDKAIQGAVSACLRSGDFAGKKDQSAVLYASGRGRVKRVILVGLGRRETLTLEIARQAAARAIARARGLGIESLATVVHGSGSGGLEPEAAAQALVEGSVLANYSYDRYRTRKEDRKPRVKKLLVLEADKDRLAAVRRGVARGRAYAEAACYTRDLCNTPSLDLTPRALAEEARKLGGRRNGIRVTVLDEKQTKKLGMGCFLGVAKGSDEPPRFLILEYEPKEKPRGTICVVGKGITFDTGGISLKPADSMDRMKYDMSGAAGVLGIFQALPKLKPDVHVIGLAACTENMPGGHAIKPGDVLHAMNGLTVEVTNTDAEGRLVLADALAYAQRYKPDVMIDMATLTGAVVIALGPHAIGMMGNDDTIKERLVGSGRRTGERVWELPTWPEYRDVLKSEVADMKNSAGREAGTIAGAMFLSAFADGSPWVHLDIAGTAWADREKPYTPKGSTGVGVRLLLDLIENW